MKEFLALVLLTCIFAVSNVFAENNSSINANVNVLIPITVEGVRGTNLGVWVLGSGDCVFTNKSVEFAITASGGFDVTYLIEYDHPTHSPVLRTGEVSSTTFRTSEVAFTSATKNVVLPITEAYTNDVLEGVYTYTFTCTAHYTGM